MRPEKILELPQSLSCQIQLVQLPENQFFEILLEQPFAVSRSGAQNQDCETLLLTQAVGSGSLLCLVLDRSYTITPTKPIPNKAAAMIGISVKIPAMVFWISSE
jgi:hypothetical protein